MVRRFSKSRENGAGESGGERTRGREFQVWIRHLMIEDPPPNPRRLEGGGVPVSLRAQSIPPRLPVRASRCVRLSPPRLPGAAPGATLSALIRRAARPPAHVTAAWRRPCPPHPDPAPLPEGAPWPQRPRRRGHCRSPLNWETRPELALWAPGARAPPNMDLPRPWTVAAHLCIPFCPPVIPSQGSGLLL